MRFCTSPGIIHSTLVWRAAQTMNRIAIALSVAILITSPAVAESFTFSLGPWTDHAPPLYSDSAMVLWTSPGIGTVDITGSAWPTYSTQSVWLQYIPNSIASLGPLNPGNVLQTGTTHLAGGTVQYPYQSPGNPAVFCASLAVPCIQVSSLSGLPVGTGDVIAVLDEQFNLFAGDIAGFDLNIHFSGDFQGSGGTQAVTGWYSGIAGNLGAGLSDAYQFYWPGVGGLGGTAFTDTIFQNGSGGGGFPNGLRLDLLTPTGGLIGSQTVLSGSGVSGPFDFGGQSAGNYTLRVTDLTGGADPPYNIEFNSRIGAPVGASGVPEPDSVVLLGPLLAGLLAGRWTRRGRRAEAR
jgi:hypothetical protein